jgi:rhodanese-related sulfurtransferase
VSAIAPSPHLVRAALLQAAALVCAAIVPTWATAHFKIKWQAPPSVESISVASAQAATTNVVWVDVRNPEDFESAHINGAVSFAEKDHDASLERVLKNWTPKKQVVVYGVGVGSDRAQRVALQLKKDLQTRKVFLLEGGWAAWPRN